MAGYKLTEEIIKLSTSKKWDEAKLEWTLETVYIADEPETCLCGKYPIKELCIIINKTNHKEATVGNCCVKKFLGLPSDKIFRAIKRVSTNNEKSLNEDAIKYAFQKGWINEWEKNFYYNICKKKNTTLTRKQLEKKKEINIKLSINIRRC